MGSFVTRGQSTMQLTRSARSAQSNSDVDDATGAAPAKTDGEEENVEVVARKYKQPPELSRPFDAHW